MAELEFTGEKYADGRSACYVFKDRDANFYTLNVSEAALEKYGEFACQVMGVEKWKRGQLQQPDMVRVVESDFE